MSHTSIQGNTMCGDESEYWNDKEPDTVLCCYCNQESGETRECTDGLSCLKCLEEIEKESTNNT